MASWWIKLLPAWNDGQLAKDTRLLKKITRLFRAYQAKKMVKTRIAIIARGDRTLTLKIHRGLVLKVGLP